MRLNALVRKPVRFRVDFSCVNCMCSRNRRTISSSRFLFHIQLQCSLPQSNIINSSTTHRLSRPLNSEQTVNFVQLVSLYKISRLRPGIRGQDLSGPNRRHKPPTQVAISLHQRFSNCGPRTTSGPRVLPLWSF